MDRNKFVAPKPKAKKAPVVEEAWLTVPEGLYISVKTSCADYPIIINAGDKYRYSERHLEAFGILDEDDGERNDYYLTAPFIITTHKNTEDEDDEDSEDDEEDFTLDSPRRRLRG